MTNLKIIKSILITFMATLFFIDCVSSATREFSGSISDLGEDIVITGSFEIYPPLKKGEQYVDTKYIGENYVNKMFFAMGNRVYPAQEVNLYNAGNLTKVEISRTFFLRYKKNSNLFISGAFLITGIGRASEHIEHMYFPGKYLLEIPFGCNVAYLGKIKYHRDIYNAITKIEVIDDFDSTLQEMQEKYKMKVEMCRIKLMMVNE